MRRTAQNSSAFVCAGHYTSFAISNLLHGVKTASNDVANLSGLFHYPLVLTSDDGCSVCWGIDTSYATSLQTYGADHSIRPTVLDIIVRSHITDNYLPTNHTKQVYLLLLKSLQTATLHSPPHHQLIRFDIPAESYNITDTVFPTTANWQALIFLQRAALPTLHSP
jgi:hypothetical protein